MQSVIQISNLNKIYQGGFQALNNINLEIKKGEILALLGPNGAGKTTLISIICGIVNPSEGRIEVAGYDIISQFRETRKRIGLVPQELTTDAFETVWDTVCFSRELFGKKRDDHYVGQLLKDLSLWEKKDAQIMTLSGGMKRRVMIAKALSHEPEILFLDEPTAGVDVSLRHSMWQQVQALNQSGVTVILTTHYIEEAEQMADRISVMNKGEILLTESKTCLMQKLGKKQLSFELVEPMAAVPESLSTHRLLLSKDNRVLTYQYNTNDEETGIVALLEELKRHQIEFKDMHTQQSSLEDIFIELVKSK
ncbi:MAG TPA: multidrug ABC transporter ATP-binding protein [Gammaproteobacteria bacterium]|nr:multidrug ABC transporter ATP-binding protein [Gammaproteobacteria bacterium]